MQLNKIQQNLLILILLLSSSAQASDGYDLKNLLKRFVDQSTSIQAAKSRHRAAELEASAALGHFGPTISAEASTQDVEYADSNAFKAFLPETTHSVSLKATQTLFAGGKVFHGYKLSRVNERVAYANFINAKNNSISTVVAAVIDWLVARDQIKVLEESEKTQKNFVNITRKRQKRGAALNFELDQAEANLFSYAPRIELSKMIKANKERELQAALALSEPPVIKIDWPQSISLPEKSTSEWIKTAKKIRPDYNSSILQLEAAKLNKKMTWGDNLPKLSVTGSIDYQSETKGDLFGEDSKGSTILFNMSVPLFSGLSGVNTIRAQSQSIYAAEKDKRFFDLTIDSDVANAQRGLKATLAQLEQTKKWSQKAQRALTLGLKSYRVGRISSAQWVQLQQGREQAELNYISALQANQLAVLQWGRALGADLEKFYLEKLN